MQNQTCLNSAERVGLRTKGNVPTLRFPEFTGEWKKERLKDNCTFFSGGTPSSTNKAYYDGSIPFIRSGEIASESTELFLSESGLSNSSAKIVEKGDLLLALYGATSGQIAISKIKGAINQAILCIRSSHNNVFLKSAWEKRVDKILQAYLQGGQGNLSAEIIKSLSFHFPSLPEQIKIGQLISLIDKRIETQSRIIEKLQSLMKGLNDYLQDFVPLSYSLSFSDIGEDYSGLSGKSAEDFGRGKPYITYVSIYANNFVEDDCCGKVSVKRDEKQNVVQKGDMLFTLSSETPEEVCYGAVYSGNSTETYLNSFCFGIRNTEGKVFSPYMAYFFNSNRFRREVYPLAQGSTRFNLQKSDFLKKQFSYPSIDDQHRIFEILNAYDNKLKTEQMLLTQYQLQKEFLLRNMFI